MCAASFAGIGIEDQSSRAFMILKAILPVLLNASRWEIYVNENGIAAVPQDPISHYVIYRLAFMNGSYRPE